MLLMGADEFRNQIPSRVAGLTIIEVGAYNPGDESAHPSALVIATRGFDRGNVLFSTHRLHRQPRERALSARWFVENGHYDFASIEDARSDIEGRAADSERMT